MIKVDVQGLVIGISSDAGSAGETVYAGAKGGTIAFTKCLARETAPYGTTANRVPPGPSGTLLFVIQPERSCAAFERAIPMRRVGQPSDVAAAVQYISSEHAGYVTGQMLSVGGGLTVAG